MFQAFYPDQWIDSVYTFDFETARAQGYRAVLFDVDNTLVPHGAPATEEAIRLFERLRQLGFVTCLMSNNKEPRVKSFAEKVDSPYLYKAGKPMKKGYLKAMEITGTTPADTLFIGDQLFTDVWGAKRCGVRCVLTKPIDPKEEIQIVFKRRLEKPVLREYSRSMQNRADV
ncbi:MAG: YqeG family HAD IIIA-type phosphatase [Lachnospiraceae bacterium]|nr:YqeG family HAD IIIA-type phosphatase [Lachnospiraceae bacterium]